MVHLVIEDCSEELLRQQSYMPLMIKDFGCDELVFYGIKLLPLQLLGTVLDIEVDIPDFCQC